MNETESNLVAGLKSRIDVVNDLISGKSSSAKLSDYYNPGGMLSSEGFEAWLKANHSGLSEYYLSQLRNAYSNYASQTFSPNIWQSIGENLGDMSSRFNFENTRSANLNDAIADILQASYQENYNDPASEVARRRAAGINDDLSGGSSIGSGDPGDIKTAENVTPALNDGSSAVQEISSSAIQFVQLCMSLYSGFESVKSMQLDNFMKEVQADSSMYELFNNTITRSVTPELYQKWRSDTTSEENWFAISDVIDNALDSIKDNPRFSSSFRRKFARQFIHSGYANTIAGRKHIMSELEKYYSSLSSIGHSGSTPFFNEDYGNMLDKITDYTNKYTIRAQRLVDQYNIDYYSSKGEDGSSLGSASGRATHKALSAQELAKSLFKLENDMWEELYRSLSGDDIWSRIGRFAIPILRGMISQYRLPFVNFSAGGVHDTRDVFLHKE